MSMYLFVCMCLDAWLLWAIACECSYGYIWASCKYVKIGCKLLLCHVLFDPYLQDPERGLLSRIKTRWNRTAPSKGKPATPTSSSKKRANVTKSVLRRWLSVTGELGRACILRDSRIKCVDCWLVFCSFWNSTCVVQFQQRAKFQNAF